MTDQAWHVGTLLETSGSYWKSCALHAGVKLDLFSILAQVQLNGAELARRSGGDTRALETLLDALCAMRLLTRTEGRYANTAASEKWLCRSSEAYVGHIILHHHHLMSSWAQLDQAVLTGGPVGIEEHVRTEEQREHFLMGMFNMAMASAPGIAALIDLSTRKKLLDLGGGPGTYAIFFCKQNPGLKADIFDLPETRPYAEKTVARFGLTDTIDFIAGDFTQDQITDPYDVAWLSHILHSEGPEGAQKVVDKTAQALESGGMMLIHEFILDDSMDGPLFPALFSLNMLVRTREGRSYSEGQLRDMLTRAGMVGIQRLAFRGPTDSGIILGYKA